MHKRIAKTILPCSVINCGPGLNPCATNAPNKIAVTLSPGIPNVNKGTNVGPFTALLAAGGDWAVGKRLGTDGANGTQTQIADNDYIYLVEGDTAATTGEFNGGKLVIRLYGRATF